MVEDDPEGESPMAGIAGTGRAARAPRATRALTLLSFCLLLAGTLAVPAAPREPVSVIVRARTMAGAAAAASAVGGRAVVPLPIVSGVAARVPASRLATLRARPGVVAVTPDAPVQIAGPVPLTLPPVIGAAGRGPRSVFARETNADKLWREGVDGGGVRVALIDTGVSPVADLADRLVGAVPDPVTAGLSAPCANFSGESTCNDTYGHGTFIAGLIAGTGALSAGAFRGVAPGAEIVSIKISGRDGSADVSKVLAAIQYVVMFAEELSIDVLNLSLGTNSTVSYHIDPLNLAVERAWMAGIVVVVSGSNRGPAPGTISKPGDDPFVITTGAVDDRETPGTGDDRLPHFSARGPTPTDGLTKPDVVAPGGRVISLRSPGSFIEEKAPGGGIDANYRRGSGTSMSAGIVSGLAALLLDGNPTWTPDRVKFALASTARRVASDDPNAVGSGLVDAWAAARKAPEGLANQGVEPSVGAMLLAPSRGDVLVTLGECAGGGACAVLDDEITAQGLLFDGADFVSDWTGSSWFDSQWVGSSWFGSSWFGNTWEAGTWAGSSWFGDDDDQPVYGAPLMGSSWFGAWD